MQLNTASVQHVSFLRQYLSRNAFGALAPLLPICFGSKWRRQRLAILCYHGIALDDEHRWRPDLYISRQGFRRRLEILRDNGACVLPLEEGLCRLEDRSLPERSIAITFDDGFADFAQLAAPLLRRFGYPATVYLTTHYVNHRYPVSNLMLDYLLWKSGLQRLELPEFGMAKTCLAATGKQRLQLAQAITSWMTRQHMNTSERNDVLRKLAERLRLDYESILRKRVLQIVSRDEVSDLSKQTFDFQLHTHRHRTPANKAELQKEIEENSNHILALTGRAPIHFCYPSGNYTPDLARWLATLGVASATTCQTGLAGPSSDWFRIPRILDHDSMSDARFTALIAGLVL